LSSPKGPVKVTFRKGVTAGAAAAENDDAFLAECFVDNGTAAILADVTKNQSVIVGRVGAGKSALIRHLEEAERCKRIDPQEFAMQHIESSSAIQLLNEIGVSLDVLFQALWKHVLTVEVLRLRYDAGDENKIREGLDLFFSSKDKKESAREALHYFKEFGGTDFWQTTEMRIREIVQRTEKSLESELGANALGTLAKLKGRNGESLQERKQIRDRCQRAVSNVQMLKLHKVVDALQEVMDDKQRKYFIVIDDLDTNWAGTQIRYRLIRALIEAIKKFRKIRNLKIVVAMRVDLLDTVFRETRDSGFQEEKFEDFFLRLRWTEAEIIEVIDRRIEPHR